MSVSGASGAFGAGDLGWDPEAASGGPPETTAEDASPEAAVVRGGGASGRAELFGAVTARPPASGRAVTMPLVREGASGPAVRELQTRLNASLDACGLDRIPVDGSYGPGTRRAVVTFQRLWGLDADGVVGAATWGRLLGEPNVTRATPRPGTVEARILAQRDAIVAAAVEHGIPPVIIAAIMDQESKGDPNAVSHRNDHGLMQINRDAHPRFFRENDWRDPRANVDYGVSVFAKNLRSFDGDVERAVAAYNAGAAGVRNGLRRGMTLDQITYTRSYVPNIMGFARKYADYF
jgi:hypothetical protein